MRFFFLLWGNFDQKFNHLLRVPWNLTYCNRKKNVLLLLIFFQMIENMKKQFSQLLYGIGFLTSPAVKEHKANHFSGKRFWFDTSYVPVVWFLCQTFSHY